MAGLNMGLIRELPLLVPPIGHQQIIMKRTAEVLNSTEALASLYQGKIAALEALKKSLLHQAFAGNL